MAMQFKDHFSKQSDTYVKFRPTYPDEIFSFLASLCPEHNLAWDCATGNGQAANGLTKYFKRIIATDASETQLSNAMQNEKIEYKNALAEDSGIPSVSVDLITVAAAVHWFDHDKFYKEVNRVLKPNGVIAAWTYNNPTVNPAVDAVMEKLHQGVLREYWPKESWLVINRYKDIPFPFERIQTPDFYCTKQMDLEGMEGHYLSWSATQRYIDATGKNPVDEVRKELTQAWGNPSEVKTVTWHLTFLVGRKA